MGMFSNLEFKEAANLNNVTYQDYWSRLKMLALTLFKWEGLPDSVNAKFLEQVLYHYGKAGFAYDELYGHIALPIVASGELNIYHEAVRYKLYSIGYQKEFPNKECVLIRNNYLERPTDVTIRLFAYRLYERERATDVNIAMQRYPGMVIVDEKERFTFQNIMQKYEGNIPVIIGDKRITDEDHFKHIDFGVPFVADKLTKEKHEIWNEAMTFLGIENSNTDKRERLITEEVSANNQSTDISGLTMLTAREEACTLINERYNLNVSVRRRTAEELTEMWTNGSLKMVEGGKAQDKEGLEIG